MKETLTSKSYKQYSYVSRYQSFPYYYNTKDGKYVYGITSNLSTETSYVTHKVTNRDSLDSLALKYYGRPDYWWIIADFNRIQDPFIKLNDKFKTIKIPSISNIEYIGE